MPIKKRRIKVRKKPPRVNTLDVLKRHADILIEHGTQEQAEMYMDAFTTNMLARLQSIAAKAEEARSWEWMKGCFKQATELYILASVLYEKFPEHVMLSDGAFDGLAKFLLKYADEQDKEFWTWYNVTSMGLEAGSGYNLAIRKPIPQYVKLITGQTIEEHDETSAQDDAGTLQRTTKRRGKRAKSGTGSAASKPVRKRLKRKEPDPASEDTKPRRRVRAKTKPSRRKS